MFGRRVADALQGGTAAAIGRAARDGVMVNIEGLPMFFRDVPSEDAQRQITERLGHPEGRLFTAEEIAEIDAAAAVNRELNDKLLMSLQTLYDDHDPRRMAGAALLGALGAGAGIALVTPDRDRPEVRQ